MLTRHCGDHFAIYANIKSLYCTSETNIMLYVNYIPQFENKYRLEKIIKHVKHAVTNDQPI